MTLIRQWTEQPSPQLTVDQRKRVAQIVTLGDYKALHDYGSLYFDEIAAGGASASTYDVANGGYTMAVAGAGEYVIRQTKQWHRYISGNTQIAEITFDNMANVSGVSKRVGYFNGETVAPYDTYDGFYLEADGTTHNFCIAKGGTITKFAQADWNQDTFDGNGKSGITIDFTKFQVMVLDFLYLGGAGVRYGFVLNGVVQWAHIYIHANTENGVFVESPQQPVRYEIRSTGGTSDLIAICSRIGSEGEASGRFGVTHAIDMEDNVATLSATATKYAMIGVRLKAGRQNMAIEPLSLDSVGTDNNKYYYWQLQINPTLSGAWGVDWADHDADSNIQQAFGLGTTRPTITADGEIIASGKGVSRADLVKVLKSALKIGSTIDGTRDELILCVGLVNSAASLDISMNLDIQDFH